MVRGQAPRTMSMHESRLEGRHGQRFFVLAFALDLTQLRCMPFLRLGHTHDGCQRLEIQFAVLAVAKPGKCLGKGKDGVVGAIHEYPRSKCGVPMRAAPTRGRAACAAQQRTAAPTARARACRAGTRAKVLDRHVGRAAEALPLPARERAHHLHALAEADAPRPHQSDREPTARAARRRAGRARRAATPPGARARAAAGPAAERPDAAAR